MRRVLEHRNRDDSGEMNEKSKATKMKEIEESKARMHKSAHSLNIVNEAGKRYIPGGVKSKYDDEEEEQETRKQRDDRLAAEAKKAGKAKRMKAREDRRKEMEFQARRQAEAANATAAEKDPLGEIHLPALKEFISKGGAQRNETHRADTNGPAHGLIIIPLGC